MGVSGPAGADPGRALSLSRLAIDRDLFEITVAHLRRAYPHEGCGLWGGRGDRVTRVIPVTNIAASATAFRMAPQEQVAAMLALAAANLDLLAIFHSHPTGPAFPSPEDVARATYPEAAHVIVSLTSLAHPETGAFAIVEGRVSEMRLAIL